MPNRKSVILPDDENLEPDVVKAMTIHRIVVPEGFKPYFTEEDIRDLKQRDQKTIAALSEVEQWGIWQTERILELNADCRLLQAEIIRLKLQHAKEVLVLKTQVDGLGESSKQVTWSIGFAKWVGITLAAGIMSAFFKWLFDHIGK